MRSHSIVVVATLLGVVVTGPARAAGPAAPPQAYGWDFSRKSPAPKSATAPRGTAASTSTSKATAVANKAAAAKENAPSAGWDFSEARPANAVKDSAAEPAPPAHATTPAPSRAAAPAASHPVTPAAESRAPAPKAGTVAAHDSKASGVHLMWGEPAAHDAAPVAFQGGAVLQWNTGAAVHVSPAALNREAKAAPVAPTPVHPNAVQPSAEAAPGAAGSVLPPRAQVPPTPVAVPPQAASAVAPVNGQPVEPRKSQPTGLDRLSDEWPKAVKVAVQYRGRFEEPHGLAVTKAGTDDSYYLNRLRFDVTIVATPWLRLVGQVQDSQVLNYNGAAAPSSVANTLDLRLGYVAVDRGSRGPFLRVGRQDLGYGASRLIASPEWGNTNRTFDALRLGWTNPQFRVEWFSAMPVVIAQGSFDSPSPTERVHGLVVGLPRSVPNGALESYALIKTSDTVTSERGVRGRTDVYTVGARATGKMSSRFDYALEMAVQLGDRAGDRIGAVAGSYVFGWNVRASRMRPRLTVEFDHASGDDNPTDGRVGTFDQLYPSNHAKYGLADQIGWKNMRDLKGGFEWMPASKLKVNVDVSRFFLATLGDAFYASSGAVRVLNRKATGRDIGTELDVQAAYAFSKELSFGAGVGALFAGDFLTQSSGAGTLWAPYLMWNVRF